MSVLKRSALTIIHMELISDNTAAGPICNEFPQRFLQSFAARHAAPSLADELTGAGDSGNWIDELENMGVADSIVLLSGVARGG